MAEIVIEQWLWEAPLDSLADDAKAATTDVLEKLSKLADRIGPLSELSLQTGTGGNTLLLATNRHEIHNLEVDLQEDWVAYRYAPAFGVPPETLVHHLQQVGEPILTAITQREKTKKRHNAWFAKHVTRTLVTYDITVELIGRSHTRGAMGVLMSALGPAMSKRATALTKELRPVVKSGPRAVGVKLTCNADLPRAIGGELSIELFGSDEDAMSATILLLSQEEKAPRDPWFCNAVALHDRLWPTVERFFESLEEHAGR